MAIYSVVTYHDAKFATSAADAWMQSERCAIGYMRSKKTASRLQSLVKAGEFERDDVLGIVKDSRVTRELHLFLKIKIGDIVIAYCKENTIAAVGICIGEYEYNDKNSVGRPGEPDGGQFNYPNQKRVKWFETPTYFPRNELPEKISEQLGKRGRTVTEVDGYSDDQLLSFLRTTTIKLSYRGKFNEELVKAGLSKYLKQNMDLLEPGFVITSEEEATGQRERPDFLAKDASGRTVIIECKGRADETAVTQLVRYRKKYQKQRESPRCFLIASHIDEKCRKEAKRNKIEFFETDLVFRKV
ncbi:MAG: DUF91 domain-containing protein [Deltaproteobacteria bacterium]|nr:DUF91 domain-containing protein [Deltaproteobacteria bacterium]